MTGTTPDNNPERMIRRMISRRELLRGAVLTAAGLVTTACGAKPTPERVIVTPKAANGPTTLADGSTLLADGRIVRPNGDIVMLDGTVIPAAGGTATSPLGDGNAPGARGAAESQDLQIQNPDLVTSLAVLGIRVELPNPNWPTSYEAVADVLRGSDASRAVTADKVVAVVETDLSGQRVWRGWYMGEVFPLKPGISYDSTKGYHVDSTGQPVFDQQKIFDFSNPPSPNGLWDIRLNSGYAGVFGRRGGVTREGLPQHSHYFSGVQGSGVNAIEQFALIPVPADLCPENWQKAASTSAYRLAVASFRDNRDARDGFTDGGRHQYLNIFWMNPETRSFESLPGRMIAKLAQEGYDLSIIDRLPAGYPISPESASQHRGLPKHWVFEPRTGEWFYDAFPLKPGVTYVPGVGHIDRDGKILVGAVQADGQQTRLFDFTKPPEDMASGMKAPGNIPAVLFVRAGGAATDVNARHHSWYTYGSGDVSLRGPSIEQATLMLVDSDGCPADQVVQLELDRARTLAQQQPDPLVTALFWNDSQFVNARN
jgi:hypothetical protein